MIGNMRTGVIIAAAGSGKRMGGKDKLYRMLDGIPVLARSAMAFEKDPLIDDIVIAVREGTEEACRKEIIEKYELGKVRGLVVGGAERALSVRAAVDALPDDCEVILVHDGARPLVTRKVIDDVVEAAVKYGAVIPVIPVKDTIKAVEEQDGVMKVADTPDRSTLRAVQTPQGFTREVIRRSYGMDEPEMPEYISRATDDASLAELAGFTVATSEGHESNLKITTPADMGRAEQILKERKDAAMQRTGIGFDVHAFAEGRKLILGGVDVPHDRGLDGHSDADVLVHAIMDALLGACALGDIGQHFPDTDARYKGINSILLLKHVSELLAEKGWQVVNVDSVIIAQKPKLAPYIDRMSQNIAEAMKIDKEQVSVKATTTERLGFTGREEGIAAQAVASVVRIQEER